MKYYVNPFDSDGSLKYHNQFRDYKKSEGSKIAFANMLANLFESLESVIYCRIVENTRLDCDELEIIIQNAIKEKFSNPVNDYR
ncbi:MAG: hypothetical protein GY804_09900 [Alphaproteobacteria bacterium]|nr:hypothetical protein [Alphaproteobacteria bacterium]